MFRYKRLLFLFFVLLAIPAIIMAQTIVDDRCTDLIRDLVELLEEICDPLMDEEACIVSNSNIPKFSTNAENIRNNSFVDIVPLSEFAYISTEFRGSSAYEWDVALLAYEKNTPETQPGNTMDIGYVRYLVVADAALSDISDDNSLSPMQSFSLQTEENTDCTLDSDKLYLITPRGVVIDVTVDGAHFYMEPYVRIVLESDEDDEVDFTKMLIEVTSGARWTDTGIILSVDQSLSFRATEFVKTHPKLQWTGAYGHIPEDCEEEFGEEWDCYCRSSNETTICTVNELPSMLLLGKVGEDGIPFPIGQIMTYTSNAKGTLYLGTNDNAFVDNAGAFYVIITREDDSTSDR